MNDSVESAIKKIKLQEEDNEAKLKEKRELEAIIANLKRIIRESISATEISLAQQNELLNTTTKLKLQLQTEQIRQKALTMQVDELKQEYHNLRLKCDQEISNVWNMRSVFCKDIHKRSDQYDIWALLVKPYSTETLPKPCLKVNDTSTVVITNEKKLHSAKERLEKVIAERDRLKTEPDIGEEFVRIKNALQYSLQSIEGLKRNYFN